MSIAILVARFGVEGVSKLSAMEERSFVDEVLPRPHDRRQIVRVKFYNLISCDDGAIDNLFDL